MALKLSVQHHRWKKTYDKHFTKSQMLIFSQVLRINFEQLDPPKPFVVHPIVNLAVWIIRFLSKNLRIPKNVRNFTVLNGKFEKRFAKVQYVIKK